jgi:hypothetical protein
MQSRGQSRLLHHVTTSGTCQSAIATCSWPQASIRSVAFSGPSAPGLQWRSLIGSVRLPPRGLWLLAFIDTLGPPPYDSGGTPSPCKNRNSYMSIDEGLPRRPSSIHAQLTRETIASHLRDVFGSPRTIDPRRWGSTPMNRTCDHLVSLSQKCHPCELGFKLHAHSCCCCKKYSNDTSILLVFSAPTNNRMYKITHFQFPLLGGNNPTFSRMILMRNKCYMGWAECSNGSRIEGGLDLLTSGRSPIIDHPRVP